MYLIFPWPQLPPCLQELVLYYFSAHWCPPCRRFTPMLAEFYKVCLLFKLIIMLWNNPSTQAASQLGVEIVFVSADQSEDAMFSYMKESHGNWFAIGHNSDLAEELNKKFKVQELTLTLTLTLTSTIVCLRLHPGGGNPNTGGGHQGGQASHWPGRWAGFKSQNMFLLFAFAQRYISRYICSSMETLNAFSGDLLEAGRSSWCLEADGRQILNHLDYHLNIFIWIFTWLLSFEFSLDYILKHLLFYSCY